MADVFKAIADETRRALLDVLLQRDEQTLFEVCSKLAMEHDLTPSRQAVSQHLDVLEQAGLVRTERRGRYKLHTIDTTPLSQITERWPLRGETVKLQTVSIFVDDQQRAVDFYTSRLGFTVTADIPMGEHRWLTIVDPDRPDGTQISLEPKGHPAVIPFTDALAADGIPFCVLGVEDVNAEYERLIALGETFTQPPTAMGPVIVAVLDDTCGNLLQLAQRVG